METPNAAISSPLQKHTVATNMAQRGPLWSTRVPKSAAERPSITMPIVNGSALAVPEMPSADSTGS